MTKFYLYVAGVLLVTLTGCSDPVGKCYKNEDCIDGYLCNTKNKCIEVAQIGIEITVDNLADAWFGTAYQATLTANGGLSPYTWEITSDMKWVDVSEGSDKLAGTPDITTLSTDVTLAVTDSTINGGTTVTKTLPMIVKCESGDCCDPLGLLRSPDWKCDELKEYQCSTDFCGAAAQERSVLTYCSGKSDECDGEIVEESWDTTQTCHALEHACDTDQTTYANCIDCTSTSRQCRFTGECGKPYNILEPDAPGVRFGDAVAIDGDYALVGAPDENEGKGIYTRAQGNPSSHKGKRIF